MTKTLRCSLLLALLATTLCLLGCQKDEPAKDSAATINADAKANATNGGAPAVVPAGAQSQMNGALNDPNTPPEVKAKIKAQMGGK